MPQVSERMSGKVTRRTANYRDGTREKHCSICTMWEPPSSCSAVAGEISPRGWCKYGKLKPKE